MIIIVCFLIINSFKQEIRHGRQTTIRGVNDLNESPLIFQNITLP